MRVAITRDLSARQNFARNSSTNRTIQTSNNWSPRLSKFEHYSKESEIPTKKSSGTTSYSIKPKIGALNIPPKTP